MFIFRIESLRHARSTAVSREGDDHFPTIAHDIFDELVRFYLRINSFEVKAEASVLCCHCRLELSVFAQVVLGIRRVPVLGGGAPLGNVLWLVPVFPYF